MYLGLKLVLLLRIVRTENTVNSSAIISIKAWTCGDSLVNYTVPASPGVLGQCMNKILRSCMANAKRDRINARSVSASNNEEGHDDILITSYRPLRYAAATTWMKQDQPRRIGQANEAIHPSSRQSRLHQRSGSRSPKREQWREGVAAIQKTHETKVSITFVLRLEVGAYLSITTRALYDLVLFTTSSHRTHPLPPHPELFAE
ncbi:hypothetical protein BDZ97DRAFT_2065341 [Flammula alnicola]|nr:hypothetical protein BDZ97DRAFT_2065341 [Flammula alnicola]